MKKEEYIHVIDQIKPDAEMEGRIMSKLAIKPTRGKGRLYGIVAASLVVLIGSGVLWDQLRTDTPSYQGSEPSGMIQPVDGSGIYIPKLELPKKSTGAAMDMVGLVVYQGNIYTQSFTSILPEDAQAYLGERIGRTKGNIDEWSTKEEYEELASTTGITDVYSVKGYDPSFRIMTFGEDGSGGTWGEFYDNLNGITVTSGADILGKLNMAGNLQSAQWEAFDSWNNGVGDHHQLATDDQLTHFVEALNTAKPLDREAWLNAGTGSYEDPTQRFLHLKLQDNSVVALRLFKGGYVMYGASPIVFQVDRAAFDAIWNQLK